MSTTELVINIIAWDDWLRDYAEAAEDADELRQVLDSLLPSYAAVIIEQVLAQTDWDAVLNRFKQGECQNGVAL